MKISSNEEYEGRRERTNGQEQRPSGNSIEFAVPMSRVRIN